MRLHPGGGSHATSPTGAATWQRRAAWLWTACISGALFAGFKTRGFDDPFITYRYAEHLAQGHGFVYNLGERVQSTTTPLYTLLLAALRLTGIQLPAASNALGCLAIALGGLALWELAQQLETPIAGWAALVLYPTFPQLLPTLGAETALYCALIIWGFAAYAARRYRLTAALLALALLTRADGALAAAAVGAHFLVSRREPLPMRAIAVYAVVALPWFLFAWLYFGAPLPVTLAAKQHQGTMAISTGFGAGLALQARDYWHNAAFRPHFALIAIGLVWMLGSRRGWLMLVGWSVLYAIAYTVLGVTNYFWYYGPLTPGVVALTALGIEGLVRLGTRARWLRLRTALAALGILALFGLQSWQLNGLRAARDSRMVIYERVGRWLQANTPATASVGTLEVGVIGYYSDRRMIDFAGLIQPETALRMGPTSTYADTALWAFTYYRPSYIVLQQGLFPQVENDATLQAACHAVAEFREAQYPFPLRIAACEW